MDYTISDDERLNLKRMVNEAECGDNTQNIRKLKHSVLIRDDIRKLDILKTRESSFDPAEFQKMCQDECPFLFKHYTDIFNKVLKSEIDLMIMTKLLTVLKMIEDEKVDQHEGSVIVGKILKELYIDSAVKHADNLDKANGVNAVEKNEGIPISWKEFKNKSMD
jgi:hypothetical protein